MGFTQRVLELIGVEAIDTIKVKSLAKETYYKYIIDFKSLKK